jgi:1-aminocyclopropane-1-carboxylate deaminase/D-cysteine desulfhydrase-like pyridoxal-dependent ACC family enzyme
MKKKHLIGFLLVIVSSICNAQNENQELDTQKMMEHLNKISKEAEGWTAKQRTIARERQQQCLDAFGHKQFCSCLNEELHWVLGFDSYIRIITAPTTSAASDSSPDEHAAIESVYKAREKCVGIYFGGRK